MTTLSIKRNSSMQPAARIFRALFVGAGLAAVGAPAAVAGPDLIVVRSETEVNFGSCEYDAPLVTGKAAIKNIGDERGKLPLGILDRFIRSLVAVYVPEHLDMLDHNRETTGLDPEEQEFAEFEVGAEKQKAKRLSSHGRFGDHDMLPLHAMGLEDIKGYQRALAQLKYYNLEIDGIPGPGFRAGVEAFQKKLGAAQTGDLTVGQAKELAKTVGAKLTMQPTAEGARVVSIYVVVDPYNFVEEDDETNNMEVWTGVILCEEQA